MSKLILEISKIAATSGTTLVGVYFTKAAMESKIFLTKTPAPGIIQLALGGVTDMVKEASSIPYVKGVAVTALASVCCLAAWRLGKVRAVVEDSVLGLKERIGVKMREVAAKKASEILPESIRAQSAELPTVMPKIQVKVGSVSDGAFVMYGSAVRIHDAIVLPAHVLSSAKNEDNYIWIKGNQGCQRYHADGFELIDTDLTARALAPEEFSKIGMPQVKLAENLPDTGEFVSICGIKNQGTVGKLMHDRTAFGKVVYSGTTMPGYSGAPYMKGQAVSGIHCWGGKVNGGYSASYVKVLIQRMLKQRCEASEDWLADKFSKKQLRKSDIRFDAGNDEAWIRTGGQYHIVSGDVFRKAKGFDYLGYDDAESMRVDESLLHSGESQSLKNPGASGDVSPPGEIELLVTKSLTKMLTGLSTKQLKQLKISNALSDTPTSSAGLLSEPKRN